MKITHYDDASDELKAQWPADCDADLPYKWAVFVEEGDQKFWPGKGPAPRGCFANLMRGGVMFAGVPTEGGTYWFLTDNDEEMEANS